MEPMQERFEQVFGAGGEIHTYFAPGRVNLIGEHTDYNGGHVFPCALTIGTFGVVRKRNDNKLRFFSMNFEEMGVVDTDLDDLIYKEKAGWTNYPKGVIWALKQHDYSIDKGMDLLLYGTIPNGSGLSSSASVEVLCAVICRDFFQLSISMPKIATLCQYAENKYNGVNCGIMDQFSIAMGKKEHAIFLDTATLEYEYAPVLLAGAKIVIANSKKKRGLGESKYNERRSECEAAIKALQTVKNITTLGELTEEEFEEYSNVIENPILKKRAKHAVYENQRTIQAVDALKKKDIALFGKLMNESHCSLRDDYEVTGLELDTLVEAAWQQKGVIGSRMTGAGFGGCTVSIVKEQDINEFVVNVSKIYKDKIGCEAEFYIVEIGNGAGKL